MRCIRDNKKGRFQKTLSIFETTNNKRRENGSAFVLFLLLLSFRFPFIRTKSARVKRVTKSAFSPTKQTEETKARIRTRAVLIHKLYEYTFTHQKRLLINQSLSLSLSLSLCSTRLLLCSLRMRIALSACAYCTQIERFAKLRTATRS